MEKEENLKDVNQVGLTKNDHTADMVDHYWGSINYITALIKASELKAGLILSFYGILLNFLYQSVTSVLHTVTHDFILYVFIGSWFVCTATSIYFCIRCFIPKIEAKFDKNIFFFGDVISKFGSVKEFSDTFYRISKNENLVFQQMGEQIFIISKIAAWKFKNVRRAIRLLAVGLFIFLVAVMYLVLATL